MSKSCLVQLVALALFALALAMGIKRYLAPATDTAVLETSMPDTQPLKEEAPRALALRALVSGASVAVTPSVTPPTLSTAAPTDLPPSGIEGLFLASSQPLMLHAPRVGGLAVWGEYLYVGAYNPETQNALLFQLDLRSKAIRQVKTVAHGARHVLGGLSADGEYVWGVLREETSVASSSVIALDHTYLEIRRQFSAPEAIAAVATLGDGGLYGVRADGARIIAWSADGRELTSATLAGGARYTDMQAVGNALVCTGTDEQGGVIDVYDAEALTLLVRHRAHAMTPAGRPVTGGGFCFQDDAFYFFPDPGELPFLMTYTLEGTSLASYIPNLP